MIFTAQSIDQTTYRVVSRHRLPHATLDVVVALQTPPFGGQTALAVSDAELAPPNTAVLCACAARAPATLNTIVMAVRTRQRVIRGRIDTFTCAPWIARIMRETTAHVPCRS